MIVFRLSKSRFARSLDGKGAEKYGGRWNSPGMAMIYTCQSRSLCLAEIAVHTATGNIPDDYNLISIEIPGRSISKIKKLIFIEKIFSLTPRFMFASNYIIGLFVDE